MIFYRVLNGKIPLTEGLLHPGMIELADVVKDCSVHSTARLVKVLQAKKDNHIYKYKIQYI